jgi:hypothetical protein
VLAVTWVRSPRSRPVPGHEEAEAALAQPVTANST